MSEFKRVENAVLSPTKCALCGAHEGPFIDTGWTAPVYGHVYVCASNARRVGCARQMARFDGMTDPDIHQATLDELAALRAEYDQAVEEHQGSRIVGLNELKTFFATPEFWSSMQSQTGGNATVTLRATSPRRRKESQDGPTQEED